MYKPPLDGAYTPPYVCARGVIDEGGKRFRNPHPHPLTPGGEGSESEDVGARVVYFFSILFHAFRFFPPGIIPAGGGGKGERGSGPSLVFVSPLMRRGARDPSALPVAQDISSKRSTRFPSSSNMRPAAVVGLV